MRRRACRIAAVVAFGAAVAVLSPGTVGAVSPDHYGWWFKANQTLVLPNVQPPTVPEGGFYVSNEPTGPAGMTAMRFFSEASGATLRLKPSGALIHDPALVVACPVNPDKQWSDEKGGQWANRAEANCDAAKVPATRTDTGDFTLEISSGFQVGEGVYEVAILPDPASPAPFEVSFQAPGPETFTPAAPPPTFSAPPSSGDFSDDFSDDFGSDFGSDFSTEPTTSFDSGSPAAVTTPPTTESQETAAPRQPFQPVATGGPAPTEELSGKRLAALAGLVLLGLGMWKLSGMEAPVPHAIGPMAHMDRPRRRLTAATAGNAADPRAGGVGRFVRSRAADPPSL